MRVLNQTRPRPPVSYLWVDGRQRSAILKAPPSLRSMVLVGGHTCGVLGLDLTWCYAMLHSFNDTSASQQASAYPLQCCRSQHNRKKMHKSLQVCVDSIQFSLFCLAQYKKFWICLKGLFNLYTYDIPDLWPHIGSSKTPKNKEKTLSGGKNGRKLWGEQQRRIPLQDGQKNRHHVTRRNHYRVTTHSMGMIECMNSL